MIDFNIDLERDYDEDVTLPDYDFVDYFVEEVFG